VIERMDYLSYYFNAMAYCGAVETLLGVDVRPGRSTAGDPPRAQPDHVAPRVARTGALDLGADLDFWYCFREREKVLDLFEMFLGVSGCTPIHPVGGVMEDIPRGLSRSLRASSRTCPTRADQTRT